MEEKKKIIKTPEKFYKIFKKRLIIYKNKHKIKIDYGTNSIKCLPCNKNIYDQDIRLIILHDKSKKHVAKINITTLNDTYVSCICCKIELTIIFSLYFLQIKTKRTMLKNNNATDVVLDNLRNEEEQILNLLRIR